MPEFEPSPVDPKPAPRGRCSVGFCSHNRHRGGPFEEIIRVKEANAEATRRRVIRVSLLHAGRSLGGSTMTARPSAPSGRATLHRSPLRFLFVKVAALSIRPGRRFFTGRTRRHSTH